MIPILQKAMKDNLVRHLNSKLKILITLKDLREKKKEAIRIRIMNSKETKTIRNMDINRQAATSQWHKGRVRAEEEDTTATLETIEETTINATKEEVSLATIIITTT